MAVLSAYHSVKDTKEAKDIWDLVAEEIKYMTKNPILNLRHYINLFQ